MKTSLLVALVLLSTSALAQSNPTHRAMAKPGETVLVCLNAIKADKKAQYERFLHDIFWPGAAKLSPSDQRVFRQTRILHPTKAEKDGTYAYFFVMDPYIKGRDYDIPNLLKKMHGEAKAREYNQLYETAQARPQACYYETQSKD
jgi:hypothetical protein